MLPTCAAWKSIKLLGLLIGGFSCQYAGPGPSIDGWWTLEKTEILHSGELYRSFADSNQYWHIRPGRQVKIYRDDLLISALPIGTEKTMTSCKGEVPEDLCIREPRSS